MKHLMLRPAATLTLVLVVLTSATYSLHAADGAPVGDAVEAAARLELQLAEAQLRNTQLEAALTTLQAEQAVATPETGTPDQHLATIEGLLKQVTEQETELVKLRLQLAEESAGDATSSEVLAEFEARCRNLEDENTILKGEVGELKSASETSGEAAQQRQTTLDERDQQIVRLQDALTQAQTAAADTGLSRGERKELDQQVKRLRGEYEDVVRQSQRFADNLAATQKDLKIALAAKESATKALKSMSGKVTADQKAAARSAVAQREQAEKIDALKETLSAATGRLKGLNKEYAGASRSQLKALEEARAAETALRDELAELRLAKASQQRENEKLGRAVADLRAASDPTHLNELRDELNAVRATESERRGTMEGLFKQLATAKGALGAAEAGQQKAEADVDSVRTEMAGMERKLVRETAARVPLEDTITALRQQIEASASAKEDLGVQLAAKDDAVDAEVAKLVALQAQINQLGDTDRQRRIAMDEALAKLATAERKHSTLQARMEEATRTYQQELTTLKTSVSKTEGELSSTKSSNADFSTQLEEFRAGNTSLRTERDQGRTEIEKLRLAVAAGETVSRETEARFARLKMTDTQRKKAMDELLEKMAGIALDGQQVAGELTATRSTLSKEILALQGKNDAVTKEKGRLSVELSTLQAELAAAVGARVALQEDVKANAATSTEQRRRVSELDGQLEEQRTIDTQRKRNMDSLLGDLAKQESAANALKAKYKGLEGQLAAAIAAPPTVVASGDESGLATALAELQQVYQIVQAETQSQQARILELEAALTASAATGVLPSVDVIDGAGQTGAIEAALAAARQTWQAESAALAQQVEALTTAQGELETAHAACAGAAGELADIKSQRAKLVRENEGLRKKIVNVRDTDLFKQIEKANVILRDKVVTLEEARAKIASDVEEQGKTLREGERELRTAKSEADRLGTDLTAAADREGEHRVLIEKLMVQMPELEQEVVQLQDSLAEKETLLVERTRVLESLKVEMEKREHRLQKAQRMTQILEDAREDVVHSSDREKRDMHYNMAMVYAREKRHADAEGEYLKALQLDPTDADSHYNLAILYDDELESPEKAVVHYKRYLKLSPHGPDADAVRSWLMKLEIK